MLLLLILAAGLVFFAWRQTFKLPAQLINQVRSFARSFHDIDFDAESLKINFPEHTIKASNLKVMLPGEKPFLEAEEATIFLASGTGPLDLYFSRAAIEKIQLNSLKYDATAPRPEKASGTALPRIPAREITVNGLNLNTSVSAFFIPDFKASFIRTRRNASLEVSFEKGPIGGNARLVAMLGLDSGESTINLSWQEKNFSTFIPLIFLSHRFGLNILSGGAALSLNYRGNLAKRLQQPSESLPQLINNELTGTVSIDDCAFSWSGLNGKINLKIAREDEKPWQGSLSSELGDGKLAVNGVWSGTDKTMGSFSADISAENILVNRPLIESLGLNLRNTEPGKLWFEGTMNGDLNNLAGSGKALARNWKYQNKKIDSADLSWQLDKNSVIELSGDLATEIGKLSASASITLNGKSKGIGQVQGLMNEIDLQKLKPFIDSPVAGKCSGPFKVAFDLNAPASTTYDMRLELHEGTFFTFSPEKLTARVYGTGARWYLSNPLALFAGGGKIAVDGLISSEKFAANVLVDKVNLKTFGVPGTIASGVASLKASIGGALLQPIVKGDLYGENLELMGVPVSSFRSQASVKGTVLTLAPLVIRHSDDAYLDGFFSIDLLHGSLRAFRLSFQKLPVEILKKFVQPAAAEKIQAGIIAGNVNYSHHKGQNVWNFIIEGHQLVLHDEKIDTLYLEGATQGKQTELKSLFARAFGGNLNISGQIINTGKFSGSIEAENLQFAKIAFLQKLNPELRGEINIQGGFEVDDKVRQGSFTVFTRDMKSGDRDLGNFGGEIDIDNAGLRISSGEFDKLGVKISGEMGWDGRQPYSAALEMNNVDLSFLPQMWGIQSFDYGGLVATGKCQVQGDLASLTPDLVNMQVDTLKIQKENDIIVSNRPMQVLYQNGSVEVRSLELKYRQGILGVEGLFDPGKSVALMINGKNFSVKALGRLFDLPNWDYDGSLSAEARLFGNLDDMQIKATAKIDELTAAGRKIPEVRAEIEGNRAGIDIAKAFVRLNASSFNLKGRVDLDEDVRPANIDLHLFIPEGPISDLTVYLPQVFREASGTVKADLHLTGRPTNPEISGDLQMTADQLALSNMRKPLTKVDFAISTNDRIINIDRLEANLGRGKLLGTGQVNFRDSLGSITANITGQKLDLSFMNLEVSNASAAMTIAGDLYNPVVAGKVFVPRGKFNITTDLLAKRKPIDFFFDSLNYHFDIEVPRNFWLKSSFLNSEMRGKFSIAGDLNNFRLDGGISCVQGKLYFKQRQFQIETGEIRFGGVDNSLDPHIFVKSEGQIQSTKVFLTLQGQVSSFTPQIYSTPPMSEGDLLALLTLGRDLNTAMHSDSKELFETEILEGLKNSYISALIGSTISTALNLDELFLSSLFDRTSGKSRAFIRVGKYIGKNIFMAYEGTMEQGQDESYIFEYRLPKGFVVNIEFKEPIKEQRIGVRYGWKFW